ncbi:unnamed protein product [Polarella glacialis]|uniref:Ubiquitin-like domain-containing protein n=1 Tax=Polarella glacialis TaxID=89957 RepID=A0A813IEC6_POLGL|nr:unnamed protein product [Polarella glacialis]
MAVDDATPTARHPLTVRVSYRGEKLELFLSASDDVRSLSAKISRRTGVVPARQRLICSGKVLGDQTQSLSALLPRAGASELAVMLMPLEATSSQTKRNWEQLLRVVMAWLATACSILFRFFHSLFLPGEYAGKDPRRPDGPGAKAGGGPEAGDLARLASAACGAGG